MNKPTTEEDFMQGHEKVSVIAEMPDFVYDFIHNQYLEGLKNNLIDMEESVFIGIVASKWIYDAQEEAKRNQYPRL